MEGRFVRRATATARRGGARGAAGQERGERDAGGEAGAADSRGDLVHPRLEVLLELLQAHRVLRPRRRRAPHQRAQQLGRGVRTFTNLTSLTSLIGTVFSPARCCILRRPRVVRERPGRSAALGEHPCARGLALSLRLLAQSVGGRGGEASARLTLERMKVDGLNQVGESG
jgi:hypothetical protein